MKNSAASAMSSGFAATCSGTDFATFSRTRAAFSSPNTLLNQRVSMKPGQMALTRIFGASARASDSTIVLSAPLEAA